MNRVYLAFCVFIALFVMVAKFIYSGNYAALEHSFAPLDVSISAKDCKSYHLLIDSGNIELLYSQKGEGIAFYPYSVAKNTICAMSRNAIESNVSKLGLLVDSKIALDDIEFISVNIGSRNFYLNKDSIKSSIDNGKYLIDLSNLKLNKSSTFMNNVENIYAGLIKLFIAPPYLFLWIAIILLFKIDSGVFKNMIEKNHILILVFIVLIGFCFRLNQFDVQSLWGDELYSIGVVAYPDDSFLSVFKDPGNPPFYNFLLKIWLGIFGYTIESARMLSVVIGTIAPLGIFLFLKNYFKQDSAIALFGALFMAISQVAIGASHEVRGYVLVLTLIPFICHYLFNLYDKFSYKNMIIYVLLSIMLVNTHYFGSIFIFSSFILSIFILKNIKKISILFLLDCIIALSLVPYFYITAFNQSLLDSSFNTWIQMPSLNDIFILPFQILGSGISMFLFIVFVLYSIKYRNKFVYFLLGICILMIIIPFIASFIRPIYVTKYIIFVIYPLIISFVCFMIFRIDSSYRFVFVLLSFGIFGVALFDKNISPIGRGDNSRAKFEFITQDSINHVDAYIVDINKIMADKRRQYEVYNLKPNAKFIKNIDEVESGILYFDAYYTDSIQTINELKNRGAIIQKIPFGKKNDEKLREKMDFIYKVILE